MSIDTRPFEGYEEWELDMIAAGDWPHPVPATLLAYARSSSGCQLERRLQGLLFRATCPPSLDLAERLLDHLPTRRAAEVDHHLASCPHCTAEMEALRLCNATSLPFIERARAVVRNVVLELTSLISPSGPRLALNGMRGAHWSATYEGESYTLSLMKQRSEEGVELVGGLLGALEEGGEVQLRRGDHVVAQSTLSLAATFTLKQPPAGEYDLYIVTGTDQLHVPRLLLSD